MRSATLLLFFAALGLAAPTATAATYADPTGDEVVTTSPVAVPSPCRDGRIDVTEITITSDGVDVHFTMTVVDRGASPTCGGVPAEGGSPSWSIRLSNGNRSIRAYASEQGGIVTMAYDVRDGGAQDRVETFVGPLAGDTLSWTVPLAGTLANGTRAYDHRGVTFTVDAVASADLKASFRDVAVGIGQRDFVTAGPVTV